MTDQFELCKKTFIDFSAGNKNFEKLAKVQEEGSLALFNILKKENIAYLADEVGMGKTFIALGTVMLMRYLNPSLRVLYITPNRQLKNQWVEEYARFIKNHVCVTDGHIRSFSGESAVPYENCESIQDLIIKASSGYVADFFVQMHSFSMAMGENENGFYKKQIEKLKNDIPAYGEFILNEDSYKIDDKNELKQHYALALNYLLPHFDLIIVDEAHKFKNGVQTSTRNQMLSLILGTSSDNKGIGDVKLNEREKELQKKLTSKVLLMSATPFDRNLEHLRNQIELFSGKQIAQKYFPIENNKLTFNINNKDKLKSTLQKFLVRRLNKVTIGSDEATRNMYRVEYRDNPIKLDSFQDKLIMALVQKHIGDLVENKQTGSPSFQMGLLASFESFADSSGVKIFDGDEALNDGKDQAIDANLIQELNRSYKDAKLGNMIPHPKMDKVIENHSGNIFANGEKHLFFVRRVKSVTELVSKWNQVYNIWLKKYLLSANVDIDWGKLFDHYEEDDIVNIEKRQNQINHNEDEVTKDTFFSWFFRGSSLGSGSNYEVKYKDFKKNMTKKDNRFSLFFEINWVQHIGGEYDIKSDLFIESYLFYIKENPIHEQDKINYFNRYHAAQFAALNCMVHSHRDKTKKILEVMYAGIYLRNITDIDENSFDMDMNSFDIETIENDLHIRSIFNELEIVEMDNCIDIFILKELLLTQFRQDHLMIDLYISLLKAEQDRDGDFITKFMKIYRKQGQEIRNSITSYALINNAKENIKLICDTTLQQFAEDINSILKKGLILTYNRNNIKLNLGRFDPIVGVSGDVGNKTLYAKKFRLPGYPIVMIATDVMQEGVNLHTFCRSVTHYGLSGTPIHIEQKNGRIDRINSLTHRKIQKSGENASLKEFHNEKIQIRFPFVKQSYEAYQIRRLSHNLNEYMKSLHDLESKDTSIDVLIDQEINDKSRIPEAYTELLKTPYEIDESHKKIPQILFGMIEKNENETKKVISLISKYIVEASDSLDDGNIEEDLKIGRIISVKRNGISIDVDLKPAKSNGEYILSLMKTEGQKIKKVQMLVGSSTYTTQIKPLTHLEEIKGLFERLEVDVDLSDRKAFSFDKESEIVKYWKNEKHIPFSRNNETYFDFEKNRIVFTFDNDNNARRHIVEFNSIRLAEREYILFMAKVGNKSRVRKCVHKIVDLVNFIDLDNKLIGYVLHDLKFLQSKEFMFCAYILAIEADTYEYKLSIKDEY